MGHGRSRGRDRVSFGSPTGGAAIEEEILALAEFGDPEHQTGWVLLRIEPKIVSLIDYTKGFGHTLLVPIT